MRIEGDKLVGRTSYSASKIAEHPWELTREGHLTDNSIGYRIINPVIIEAGQTAEIEGRKFTAPANRNLRIGTEWEVKENSVCPIGADAAAKNRNENIVSNRKDSTMNFREWLNARGLDHDKLSDEQRSALEKDFEAEQARAADDKNKKAATADAGQRAAAKPAKNQPDKTATDAGGQRAEPAVDPQRTADDAVAAERQRVNDIRELGGDDVDTAVIERCISDGSTLDAARAAILDAVRSARPAVGAPAAIVHNSEVNRQILEDSLLLRAGNEDILLADKTNGEKRADIANRHRDICLVDICRQAIILDGGNVPFGREEMIRAAFSTATLTNLLANVANKSMLKGYNSVPATWQDWCTITSVPDFKTKTGIRLTDMGSLEEVGAGGEVKHGSVEEEAESYNIASYAKTFSITRIQIINDDLDALTKQPQRMGVRAGKKPGDLVYAHLMANGNMSDGVALFHADHNNLNTGKPLTADNLANALIVFAKQTDKDGQPIAVPVAVLLVPPDLRYTAMELVKSVTLIVAGAGDTVRGSHNVLSEENIKVVSETRMSNAAYTGYSTTSYYLMGDKNQADNVEVAFLNGRQQPTLERFNPGPDVMGIVLRVFHDCGCKAMDQRTMQKNNS